jgi:hypothetical protein
MHVVGDSIIIWGGCYIDVKCFNDLYMFDIRLFFYNAYDKN